MIIRLIIQTIRRDPSRSDQIDEASDVVARLRDDPATRADAARRGQQGKSSREVRRCLQRAVARQLFKLLERYDRGQVEILSAA